jgi:hypothetical protein
MTLSTKWLIVLGFSIFPILLLFPFGLFWMWERHLLLGWLGLLVLFSGLGLMGGYFLRRAQVVIPPAYLPQVEPYDRWSEQGKIAWQWVETMATEIKIEDYPLTDHHKLLSLAQQVIERIAQHYHPYSNNSVWEIPFPYLLKMIELVSADLRTQFVTYVPASHIITVNDLLRGRRLTATARRYYTLYRMLAVPVNPASALLREIQQLFTKKLFNIATDNIKLWLLQSYIKKVGYYAIELYSGAMVLDEIALTEHITLYSQKDAQRSGSHQELSKEPLRILILGQTNSGKSSLINALFGEVKAQTDVIPTTRSLTPYLLEREGMEQAIIFDSVGYEDQQSSQALFKQVEKEVLQCDFILLVCAATQAARQPDKELLEEFYKLFREQPQIPVPPLLVILTHIDQLRPLREWQPPYNIAQPDSAKAQTIRQAMEVTSEALEIPLTQIIPTSLKNEAYYNIEEGIIPSILNQLDHAKKVRYLRCLRSFKKEEQWQQLWKQAYRAGKVIIQSL